MKTTDPSNPPQPLTGAAKLLRSPASRPLPRVQTSQRGTRYRPGDFEAFIKAKMDGQQFKLGEDGREDFPDNS